MNCKVVLDAIFTTALNDQVVVVLLGAKGVKTPPVAAQARHIIAADHYSRIHDSLPDDVMRLLVKTDIASGLRWGELTELRVKDLDLATGVLAVSRAVVQLTAKHRLGGARFVLKDYPKDREWRRLCLAPHLVAQLRRHITEHHLAPGDLIFALPEPSSYPTTPCSPGRCRRTCAGANANARHPDVLAAQRRERAPIRSERHRWGRLRSKAA